jgi:hypothetical protein
VDRLNPITPTNPYPTRHQAGAYERNERAFGPAAATVIGLADAVSSGATDLGQTFGDALQAAHAASQQVGRVAEEAVDALEDAASWLGEGITEVASDLAVVALLVSAGAATGGRGSAP